MRYHRDPTGFVWLVLERDVRQPTTQDSDTTGERWARYCEDAGRRGRLELTYRLAALNTFDLLLDQEKV